MCIGAPESLRSLPGGKDQGQTAPRTGRWSQAEADVPPSYPLCKNDQVT